MTSTDIVTFLNRYKVEKGSEYTHTSFAKPSGSFYVPASQMDRLYTIYGQALDRGDELHMTERHRHISPVIVDLDFRYDDGSLVRKHTNMLSSIALEYARTAATLLKVPSTFIVYVMEKPSPVSHKGLVKDGIHIVIPQVVTRPAVQYMIRNAIIPKLTVLMDQLRLANRVEDVVDEAIIERNNWMMYGSRKPMNAPYTVTGAFKYAVSTDTIVCLSESEYAASSQEYVELFSIRNKHTETTIREDCVESVNDYTFQMEERQRRRDAINRVLCNESNVRNNTCEDLNDVSALVDMLGAPRAENYSEWVRVGWCLRNIDYRLLEKWVEFSRKSSKYIDGECPRLWNNMRQGGLGIGSLHMWARQDSPDLYRELLRSDLRNLILVSLNGSHHDVARVVFRMYRYDYVCASIRNRCWYEFRDHRWRISDSACSLRKRISDEVFKEYVNLASMLQTRLLDERNDSEQKSLIDRINLINKIALQLKNTNMKDNIVRECSELFHCDKFEELLDSNCNLIGFENGVYDLERAEFRDGRPDDYVSNSTGNNYIPFDRDHPIVKDIEKYWEEVHPDRAVRGYVLQTLAACLTGNIMQERFNIWTGSGSNSKSLTCDLFEKAFGGYCVKFPITLLTQKRVASNAATSEIARAKGKRFGVLQEPSEDEKLNIGLMKELTGGDRILARPLYKEPFEFQPQFKLFLLCNQLPNVPSEDGGTWRRIRVVNFGSKFVENPNPDRDNEFPIDLELPQRIASWKEHFMAMLIDIYHKSAHGKIREPDAVLEATREYQRNNDFMADFLDSHIERSTDATSGVRLEEVFKEFRDWAARDHVTIKSSKKKELQHYMDRTLIKGVSSSGGIVFRGYRFKDRIVEDGGDDAAA